MVFAVYPARMITVEYLRTMAAYNAELNRRVYGAALTLTDEQRQTDEGAFFKSIHGTLAHVLWADQIWMARFGVGEPPPYRPIAQSGETLLSFDELWSTRQTFDADIITWANQTTPEDILGEIEWFSGATQQRQVKPKALCIMQLFNHQTHHRGQVHAILTRRGASTGDTDLPFVL